MHISTKQDAVSEAIESLEIQLDEARLQIEVIHESLQDVSTACDFLHASVSGLQADLINDVVRSTVLDAVQHLNDEVQNIQQIAQI